MPGYFHKFPITEYKGVPSINILKRTGFNENVRRFLTSFYTYTIKEGFRIDSIAHDYYDDVNYDWLIYQTNDIVDPYYQAPLNQFEFEKYIVKKYGSLREANRKTAFYRNNFRGDDTILNSSGYDSLPASLKKYWNPIQNALSVIGYERSSEDFTSTTNKIISITFRDGEGQFTVGEIIEKESDTNSFGEVIASDEEGCIIQHVRGSFTQFDVLKGDVSKVTRIVESTSITNVIPEVEQVFYSPVSFYDLEVERNESNAEIFLVEKAQLQRIDRQLSTLLK